MPQLPDNEFAEACSHEGIQPTITKKLHCYLEVTHPKS
jgi:hypothetical protein